MTTKKTTGTKATTTPATADYEKLEELAEPTAVEQETAAGQQDEEPQRTFTVEIGGKERELKDMAGESIPAVAMFMGNNRMMEKYAPVLLETILGEDQLMDLMFDGLELNELSAVLVAWVKSRNLGN